MPARCASWGRRHPVNAVARKGAMRRAMTPIGDRIHSLGAGVQARDDSFPCLEEQLPQQPRDSFATASQQLAPTSRQPCDSFTRALTGAASAGGAR